MDDNWFFELVEPEEISYTYKVRPAKNFGAEMVCSLSPVVSRTEPTQQLHIVVQIVVNTILSIFRIRRCSVWSWCP